MPYKATVTNEIEAADSVYNDMKKAQQLTQRSAADLNQMFTSASVESQKLDKTSVAHHIDQYCDKLANECKVSDLGESIKNITDKSDLDKTITDFIRRRAHYNQTVILKNMLNGVHKLTDN